MVIGESQVVILETIIKKFAKQLKGVLLENYEKGE